MYNSLHLDVTNVIVWVHNDVECHCLGLMMLNVIVWVRHDVECHCLVRHYVTLFTESTQLNGFWSS